VQSSSSSTTHAPNIDELTARGPLARPEHGRPGTAQARHGPEVTGPGPSTARAPGRAWAASSACRAARHGPPKKTSARSGPATPTVGLPLPASPAPANGRERASGRGPGSQAPRAGPKRRPQAPALYDPAGAPSPSLTLIPIHSRPALAPACHPLRRRSDSAVARRASPRWTSPRRLVLHRRVATSSSPPLSFSLTSSSPVCSSLSTASSSSSPPSSVELVFFHLSGAGLRLCRQVHPPQDLNPSL